MWKLIPLFLLVSLPVKADITHKLSSSVQLTTNAAATQVERIGTSYAVSGSGVDTTYTPTGGSAVSDGLGSLTISSGVGAVPSLEVTQKTAGNSFSFTQSFTQGDAVATSAPSVGAVGNFSSQTSTAAGSAGDLAGTITTSGAVTLTGGGAGSSAIGQFVSEISVK
tara:strand:+ start:172 stop:669 length:498 start_codon:yes stop_codon:yes gene_type:complete